MSEIPPAVLDALMRIAKMAPGQVEPGNIDLARQPRVLNPDGSISTVNSRSSLVNGLETLIPSMIPTAGGGYSTDQTREGHPSWREFDRTGRHLGRFLDPASADAYAEQLHNDYEAGKYDRPGKPTLSVNGSPIELAPSHINSALREALLRLMRIR